MVSIKKILCPVDFFPASDAAVDYAVGLAAAYDAEVHLLHVITPIAAGTYEYAIDTTDFMKDMEERSMEEMNRLAARLRASRIVVDSKVRTGDVYEEIKAALEDLKPDLIVMGTHGRRGVERWFMGSTTEKLLRHTPVPLVTISATGEKSSHTPRFRRILVTTDFSEGTADALAYAFSVAQENQSKVVLLHVLHDIPVDVPSKYRDSLVQGVVKQLEDLVPVEARSWCEVAPRVETGIPYQVILQTAQEDAADLVVMNIHGKGMLDRALLGSTAERVVRAACCPVMMIPPFKRKLKRRPRPGGIAAA
jgi:nucleotide-binding universal stress UspA family protein